MVWTIWRRIVLINSDELCNEIASIHRNVERERIDVRVKIRGKQTGFLQPVNEVYFDEHHKNIILVIDEPTVTISL